MRFAERPPVYRIRIGGAFVHSKRAYSGEYLGPISDSLGSFSSEVCWGRGLRGYGKLAEYLVFEFVS